MPSSQVMKVFLHGLSGPQKEVVDWGDFRIGYFYMKNKDANRRNEDSLFLHADSKKLIFGVADGAGGHPRGDEAAFLVGETILENSQHHDLHFANFFEQINDRIIGLKAGAYSTAVVASISGDVLRTGSVGDSEIVYWNANSNEVYSNIPHSQVGYSIEAGVITQGDSLLDSDRSIVDNLLGETAFRMELSSKMELKKGHTILLGSDGLFDNLSHDELKQLVGGGVFEKSFEELCTICEEQKPEQWKKEDDISFVIVRKVRSAN